MAIKMQTLSCPKCNAPVDIRGHQDRVFCSFCGTQILLEDSNTKTINKNININRNETVNKNYHYTHTDEAKIKKYETERATQRLPYIFALVGLIVLVMFTISGKRSEAKELAALDAIVEEVQQNIKDEDYTSARINASKINATGSYSGKKIRDKYDAIREQLLEEIDKAEGNSD